MDTEKGLVGMVCLRRKEWIMRKDKLERNE